MGTERVTLMLGHFRDGDCPPGRNPLRPEIILGLIHGLAIGAIIGAIVWVWEGDAILAGVLALAMTGNMVVASVAGAGAPLLLPRLCMDPAVSAAVFVTTFTDVIGFALFLGWLPFSLSFWSKRVCDISPLPPGEG